jgi:hypothetical protein
VASDRFPCPVVEFPVTYLCIPLVVGKLPRSALEPILEKVMNALLVWKGRLMHKSGRHTLIQSTISPILVYTTISLHLPLWLQKSLVKVFKAFLWTGTNVVQGGKCMFT